MPLSLTTNLLKQQLAHLPNGLSAFKQAFDKWHDNCAKGIDYQDYYFGKDGAYTTPLVNNTKYVLRHVHLAPVLDQAKLKAWNKAYRHRARRTSDRVLIYVPDKAYGALLIHILDEPTAHAAAQQRTPAHKLVMKQYAAIAEAFIFNGEVIA